MSVFADAGSSSATEVIPLVAALEAQDETTAVVTGDEVNEDAENADGGDVKVEGESSTAEGTTASTTTVDQRDEELAQLRIMLRNQHKELVGLKATVERHDKVQKGTIGDVDANIPSEIETLHAEIAEIAERRSESFDILLEAMTLNPKYEDVQTVCSRNNLDDLIEIAATNLAASSGRNKDIIALELEKEIWSQNNPYRVMYENIMKYHPKYAQKETVSTDKTTEKPAETMTTRPLTPAKAPGSVSALGGGDGDIKGGWTSAKIDAMDEMELKTVPRDIYDKYLMGQLP